MNRYRFPSTKEIAQNATGLSKLSWSHLPVHSKFSPKEAGVVAHVGQGVFLSRCEICGEYFLNPGPSYRPANLVTHLFEEHDIYDGFERPFYAIDGELYEIPQEAK